MRSLQIRRTVKIQRWKRTRWRRVKVFAVQVNVEPFQYKIFVLRKCVEVFGSRLFQIFRIGVGQSGDLSCRIRQWSFIMESQLRSWSSCYISFKSRKMGAIYFVLINATRSGLKYKSIRVENDFHMRAIRFHTTICTFCVSSWNFAIYSKDIARILSELKAINVNEIYHELSERFSSLASGSRYSHPS